ncbi:MAG: tRNA 4-thiouridine(8) synthase ThiI [Parcubacteria group bacterium]|nr:tRNA 4-thiouridine(8) synthase ThiI [Parcubacteria group bacterium]
MRNNKLVICHYAEIGLKGKNRKFFEEKLVDNIKQALPEGSFKHVKRISGRILVYLSDGAKESEVGDALKTIFGLAYFAFAQQAEQSIESISQKAVEILKDEDFETFRIDAKRSNKEFALSSQEINEQIGGAVIDGVNKKVKLENPDVTLFIQIVEKFAFLFIKKIRGLGGLPVGVSSRAVSLLSGGIDSPVASFLAMKRGVEVVFCHFHAVPYVDKKSVDKVKQLAEVLTKYQGKSKLYLIPFGDIQKEILLKTTPDLRVVLYRRIMFKIAEEIANKEKAKALVTGESIGQVASQTIENIAAISEATSLPILRPLITYDKEEIIEKAKEIDTYELSILPHQDCCARFLPKHPATKANLNEVQEQEQKINLKELIEQAIKNSTVEIVDKSK